MNRLRALLLTNDDADRGRPDDPRSTDPA